MNSELNKQIEVLDKQIEGQKKQITFNKNAGKTTMSNTITLNELITQRADLIKHGDSQQEITEIRAGINEKIKIVEKLTQKNQILKHGKETYDKMQTEFVESAKKLLASLNL